MDKCKDLPTPLCWAILERVSEGFVLLDKKLHVMWANVAAEKLLGASYDKLKIGGQLPFFDEVNAAHFAQMVSNLFSSPSFSEGMLLFRIGIDKMYLHVRVSLEQWNDATYYIVKIEDPLKSAQDAVIVNLGVHLGIVEMVDSKHLNSISMNEYTLSSTGFTKYNIAEQDCAKVFRYDPNSSTNVWSSMYKQILETKKVCHDKYLTNYLSHNRAFAYPLKTTRDT